MVQLHDGDLPTEVFERFRAEQIVAFDTETTGLDWLSDRLALVQLFSPNVGTHLVRVKDGQLATQVCQILEMDSIRKIFHHAPFDLAFMKSAWGVDAKNSACTKIASKILWRNQDISHSLQPLLERVLGIHIDKGSIRTSNWAAENLSSGQLEYATNDVVYLIPLLLELERALASKQMLELFQTCCTFLPTRAKTDQLLLQDIFSY